MSESGGGPKNGTALTPEYLAETDGPTLEGEAQVFIVLTTVVVILRFYAKAQFQAQRSGLPEVFLVVGYLFFLGVCAIGIWTVHYAGVGKHVEAATKEELTNWAKGILSFEMVYYATVMMPKLAVLFFYLQVFGWKGWRRTATLTTATLVAATSVTFIIIASFTCQPLAFWWDRTIPGGHCYDVQAFFKAQAVPGIVLDIPTIILPLESIWRLKMPLVKRLGLVIVFLVGGLGIIAAIIRMKFFFNTKALQDRTRASVDLLGWSIIETGSYIMAVCLPHMRPLLAHYTPAWLKRLLRVVGSAAATGTKSLARSRSRSVADSSGKRCRIGNSNRRVGDDSVGTLDDDVEFTATIITGGVSGADDSKHDLLQHEQHKRGSDKAKKLSTSSSTPSSGRTAAYDEQERGRSSINHSRNDSVQSSREGRSWLGDSSPTPSWQEVHLQPGHGRSGSGGITVTREITLTRSSSVRALTKELPGAKDAK